MTRGSRGPVASFAVALALACAACGGAADTDLFSPGPSTLDGSTAPAGGTATGGPFDPDATAPGTDGGVTPPDAGVHDAGPRDTGPPHAPSSVGCGAQRCAVPAQDCCRTLSFANEVIYTCVDKGACSGFQSLTVPCDDSADCAALGSPGGLCCYSATSNGVTEVRCRPQGECLKPARGTLCDPAQPIATACPNASGANVTCGPSSYASFDFAVCAP